MPTLKFERRSIGIDHGGRVYFCAHPAESERCEGLIRDVLAISDCIACYDSDPTGTEDAEWQSLLADMQLFVVAVSRRFLTEVSRAKDVEVTLAQKLHIPILPILTEAVSLTEYNAVFPDIQYLDPLDESDAALPYAQKLERALGEVLQQSDTRAKIRDSFDLSFFLSYRKKDRRGAQRLLEKIHGYKQFRSVAIWYDEFLLPGEDFNRSIDEAMDKSSLFLLSVTPHMLEPTNYVLNVEFPAAVEKRLPIVAVETERTDRGDFSSKFDRAPTPIPLDEENALFSALSRVTDTAAQREPSPEQTYHLGLAYLGGIAVEVNRTLGVHLIREAADEGYLPALQKLIQMFRCGEGVARDYGEVIRLHRVICDRLFEAYQERTSGENLDAYLSAMIRLADEFRDMGNYDAARETLNKTRNDADYLRCARENADVGHTYMHIAVQRLAAVERLAGNTDEAILILKSNLPYFRFEAEQSGSRQDRRGLAVLLQELANLYAEKGNINKSEKYAGEAIALNEELVEEEDSSPLDRYNLAVNLFNKAIALSAEDDHRAAVEVCEQGTALLTQAMEHHESCALYIRFHILLGEQYEKMENAAEAKATFERAIDICEAPTTPQDIVILKLKAEAMRDVGRACLSLGDVYGARRNLRAADTLYEKLIGQYGERKLYHDRAATVFLDGQICQMQGLLPGARYNYEKCVEYMEAYNEERPDEKGLHILAYASFIIGSMNRAEPDVPALQRAFTIWNELAAGENGQKYARHRDEVAAILVRFMF